MPQATKIFPGNPMTDAQKTAQDLTRIEIRLFLRADRQA